jgi:cyclase
MKRFSIGSFFIPALAAGCLMFDATDGCGQTGSAGSPPGPEPILLTPIRGEIYMVKGGSGANTGLYAGPTKVFAIDAKMDAPSARDMVGSIGHFTDKPLGAVLITHSDRDHVDGLAGFPEGVTTVSHESARREMDAAFSDAALRARLPQITFSERAVLYDDSARIEMLYFGPAHTSGDAVVYFPDQKVVFTGDLLFVGRDPLIHLAKNGTSFGLVKVLRKMLELDADTFVPGHGDVAGRSDVEAEIRSLEEKQAAVKALVDAGKTLDDVKKQFGVQEGGRWPSLVEVIYTELTEKK